MELPLSEIKSLLLNPRLSESQLVKEISKVSKAFTSSRDQIGNYVLTEEGVSAYTYFYLPTNFPKLKFILGQLKGSTQEYLKSLRFVDIGCGPGTYSLGFGIWAGKDLQSIKCVDESSLMLNQAKNILSKQFPDQPVSYYSALEELPKEPHQFFFFGHSINEMGKTVFVDLISKHKPEAILWIEPGTPDFFKVATDLRSYLIGQGYQNFYPCGGGEGSCPIENHERDWCHQIWRGKHSDEVERLSQLVKLDRKSMPMIAHLYIQAKSNLTPRTSQVDEASLMSARLVNFIKETKFSFIWDICLSFEKPNYQRVEILKKSLSKKQIKDFQKVSPGEERSFKVIKEREGYTTVEFLKG